MEKAKPVLNKRMFGDTNFNAIDYEKSCRLIIERVFEYGDVEDIRNCIRYYGGDTIREILTTAECLSLPCIYLAAAVCDNDITDYKSHYIAVPKSIIRYEVEEIRFK